MTLVCSNFGTRPLQLGEDEPPPPLVFGWNEAQNMFDSLLVVDKGADINLIASS